MGPDDGGIESSSLPSPDIDPGSETISLLDVECTIGKEGIRVNDRRADHLSALVFADTSNPNPLGIGEPVCTFYFKKEDFEENSYGFAISFRMRKDIYEGEKLTKSTISMMQHLIGRVSKPNQKLVLEYQWLGGELQTPDLSNNAYKIAIPPYSFGQTAAQSMALTIQLAEIDEDGFTPGALNLAKNSGGGSPAAEASPRVETGAEQSAEFTSSEGGEAALQSPFETEGA